MKERVERSPKTRPQDAINIPASSDLEKTLFDSGIARTEQTPKGTVTVVDVPACKTLLQKKYGSGGGRKEAPTQRLLSSFAKMFPGGVVSREQAAVQVYKVMPLFYFPSRVAEATTTSVIKSAQFHLRIADVLTAYRMRTKLPIEDSDSISAFESEAALAIFHPSIGNGYRDEDGVLMIQDPDSAKYVPFSAQFLTKVGVSRNYLVIPEEESMHAARADVRRSMREGARKELPHLVEKKILIPEQDFLQISLGNERVNARQIEKLGVSSAGSRMLNGVLHYIGREFHEKPVRIMEISPSLGCVVDESGEPRVTHLFNIFSRDKLQPSKSNWYLAKKEDTQVTPFNSDVFGLYKMKDETQLQFQGRKEAVDRGIAFLLLNLVKEHPELTELFRPERKQVLGEVARAAYWMSKEGEQGQLDDFVTTYGAAGLRTFLVTAVDSEAGKEIMAFAQEADQDTVKAIFKKFAEFADHIEGIEGYLTEHFPSADRAHIPIIVERLLRRGRMILGQAHALRNEPEKIRVLLENIDVEARTYSDICKQLAKEGSLTFEQLKDVDVLMIPGGGIKGTLQQAVRDMQNNLYKDRYANLLPILDEKLKTALSDPNTRLHLAVHKNRGEGGEVVTSTIFRDVPVTNETRIQTVLLNPKFEGSSLGGINFISALAIEFERAPERHFTLECDPSPQLLQFYGKSGFVFTRFYQESREPTVAGEKSPRTVEFAGDAIVLSLTELRDRSKAVVPSGEVVYKTGKLPEKYHDEFEEIMNGEDGKGPRALLRYEIRDGAYYAVFKRLPTSFVSSAM